jgi:hypothetical protein
MLDFSVIEKRDPAVCQFASPLDCDQHNKPEAVVLEGKYWKRRLATVTAEYKKWRIFFKNKIMGRTSKDLNDLVIKCTFTGMNRLVEKKYISVCKW